MPFLFSLLRHTTQTMVIKKGKNDQLVWDGSTTMKPTDIVKNQITPMIIEAPITFGHVKMQMYIDIYNTRISYPRSTILLAAADIKACFRFARLHADLTGAFGFFAGGYYNLATAMVFGSTASASSWEPFRRAIEALSVLYLNRPKLVKKHRKYLDMLSWAADDDMHDIYPAMSCEINSGILDDSGNPIPLPARIYVNDALVLATSKAQMKLVLAVLIEAIFVVMGYLDEKIRLCPLVWGQKVIPHEYTNEHSRTKKNLRRCDLCICVLCFRANKITKLLVHITRQQLI
jgi:hypothetical protein